MNKSQLKPPNPGAAASERLDVRLGRLARTDREDPNGTLDEREPDELFAPLDDFASEPDGPRPADA